MIVECDNCHTKFKLADEKVTPKGVKIRCSKCLHVFVVRRPPPEPAMDRGGDFSVDTFGGEDTAGQSFSDFDAGPVGGAGKKPAPRAPGRPNEPDRVFHHSSSSADLSRNMGIDLGDDTGPDEAAAPASAQPPPSPGGGGGSPFDDLDELFGPRGGAKPPPGAPPPPPQAKPARPAPQPARPPEPMGEPFSDATSLDEGRGGVPAEEEGFGDLFESNAAGSGGDTGGVSTSSFFGDSTEKTSGEGDEEFGNLLSGEDEFFGTGSREPKASLDFEAKAPADEGDDDSPTVRWGPRKKGRVVEAESGSRGIVFGVLALIVLLVVGARATVEFLPQQLLQAGVEYDLLQSIRNQFPFVENPDFPKPPPFWEARVDQTFWVRETESGSDLFVARGMVKNVGSSPRQFFELTAQAVTPQGEKIGDPVHVFAGNTLDVHELKRFRMEKIREELNRKIGDNGSNIDVRPGSALPFMMVFVDPAQEPARVEIVSVDAQKTVP